MNNSKKIIAIKSFFNKNIKVLKKNIRNQLTDEFVILIKKKYLNLKSKSKSYLLIISEAVLK